MEKIAERGLAPLLPSVNSLATTLVRTAGLLSLRRLLGPETFRAATAPTLPEAAPLFLRLHSAVRHAWLTVEVALGGPAIWSRIPGLASGIDGNVFRQQMETLLDLLSLAGLGIESAETRQRFAEELRLARENGTDGVSTRGGSWEDSLAEDESASLESLAAGFEQAGYVHLAQFIELRSLGKTSMLVGMVEYFLLRSLRNDPDLARLPWIAALLELPGGYGWRCLESMARFLPGEWERVQHLIDSGEETLAPGVERSASLEEMIQRGLSHLHNAQYRQAIGQFTAGLQIDPTLADLYAHRGQAHYFLCELERAIADFSAALQLQGKAPTLLVSRAGAYHLAGEFQLAFVDCQAALDLAPDHLAAYRVRGMIHADLGDFVQAVADFTTVLNQTPDDVECLHQRGVLLARQGDYAGAIGDFTRLLDLRPNYILAYLHRGHANRARGDPAQAVLDYSEVLRRHRGNAVAHANRGMAHELLGDLESAIADYSEALRLEPESPQVYRRRGMLHRVRGDLPLAQADFDEAIRLQPEHASAYFQRGKVHLALGQLTLALVDLEETLRLNPNLAAAYLVQALVLDGLGRYSEAAVACTRALRLENRSAGLLVRGVVIGHAGRYDRAAEDLSQALLLDPECILAYLERGVALSLQGKYAEALADFDHVLAREPRNALAYAGRCQVHQSRGDEARALLDFSRAMKADPRCLMPILHQHSANAARQHGLLRLADYVEGVRRQADPGDAPRPADFLLARVRPQSRAAVSTARRIARPSFREVPGEATLAAPVGTAPTDEMPAVSPAVPSETMVASSAGTLSVVLPPRDAEPTTVPVEDSREEKTATPAPRMEEEIRWDDVPATKTPADGPKASADLPVAADASTQTGGATCPICQRRNSPLDTLPDGRARCSYCKVLFVPGNVTPRTPSTLAPTLRRARRVRRSQETDESDEGNTRSGTWGVLVAATVGLVLIGSYFGIGRRWIGSSRNPVATVKYDRVTIEELCQRAVQDRRLVNLTGERWPVIISGEIENVDASSRIVYLKTRAGGPARVACHLAKTDKAGGLSSGSRITVQGACEGRDLQTFAVHVVNCEITQQ